MNSFDLLGGKEDGWEMLRKLTSPYEFCKYCVEPCWYDWEISGKAIEKEDWLVEENEGNGFFMPQTVHRFESFGMNIV